MASFISYMLVYQRVGSENTGTHGKYWEDMKDMIDRTMTSVDMQELLEVLPQIELPSGKLT